MHKYEDEKEKYDKYKERIKKPEHKRLRLIWFVRRYQTRLKML